MLFIKVTKLFDFDLISPDHTIIFRKNKREMRRSKGIVRNKYEAFQSAKEELARKKNM